MRLNPPRRALLVTAAVAAVLLVSGCSAPAVPSAATHSPSATPTPEAPALDFPVGDAPGQVAFARVDSVSSTPTVASTTGPGLLDGAKPLIIEGRCVGQSGGTYRLTTADPADAGRILIEGTLTCGQAMRDEVNSISDYEGPVQLSFTATDGIRLGWLRVVQEPAA